MVQLYLCGVYLKKCGEELETPR